MLNWVAKNLNIMFIFEYFAIYDDIEMQQIYAKIYTGC